VTSNDEIGTMTQRFNHMVGQLRERERIREAFGKYVSTSVARQIIEDDDGRLEGDVRLATIMFTDIRNFTTISEALKPAETIELLNAYLELVIEPIRRHGGVINNFIGDGLFVTFNLPIEDPHHADSAVQAAVDITRALDAHTFPGGLRLETRIGINTGVVVAGTIGAGDRLSYTVLGDEVNIAARTEPLNKEYGSRILITASTWHHLRDRHRTVPVGEHEIRGREKKVQLYKVEV
jgi:class 3 adenylate cyclase